MRRALEPCRWAEVNAALMLHEHGAGEAEVRAYLERWGLMTPGALGPPAPLPQRADLADLRPHLPGRARALRGIRRGRAGAVSPAAHRADTRRRSAVDDFQARSSSLATGPQDDRKEHRWPSRCTSRSARATRSARSRSTATSSAGASRSSMAARPSTTWPGSPRTRAGRSRTAARPSASITTSTTSRPVTTGCSELGGSAEDPQPVPGMGWFVTATDPEGNAFGLWQNDPNASMG